MGDVTFRVVPADMGADAAKWGAASEALRRAHRAVPALGVSFGAFQSIVGAKYCAADLAVQNLLEVGESRLRATGANVTSNTTRTSTNDKDADDRVRTAAGRGGGGGGGAGESGGTTVGGSFASGSPTGPGGPGGKGEGHYAELMGPHDPMPADPKDPGRTFDRQVDPETGEVSWTPRDLRPGEGTAVDGRDVERIPARADRIVVTMVDGEPQITYVDKDAQPGHTGPQPDGTGPQWQQHEGRPVAHA